MNNYIPEANKIQGWMSPLELSWLFNTAKKYNKIAEVGSWKGRSSHALLSGCPGVVYCIDHWQGSANELKTTHKEATTKDIFEQFMQNVGHFDNLITVKADHSKAADLLPHEFFDMVFIDGDHCKEAVKVDILTWKPKCTFLCGHDAQMINIKEIAQELNINVEIIPRTSIWYLI